MSEVETKYYCESTLNIPAKPDSKGEIRHVLVTDAKTLKPLRWEAFPDALLAELEKRSNES